MNKIKHKILKLLFLTMDTFRPFLGPPGTCIYPISCKEYTKKILLSKPLHKAIPIIIIRLLSCNPITSIYWKIKIFIHNKHK